MGEGWRSGEWEIKEERWKGEGLWRAMGRRERGLYRGEGRGVNIRGNWKFSRENLGDFPGKW